MRTFNLTLITCAQSFSIRIQSSIYTYSDESINFLKAIRVTESGCYLRRIS